MKMVLAFKKMIKKPMNIIKMEQKSVKQVVLLV